MIRIAPRCRHTSHPSANSQRLPEAKTTRSISGGSAPEYKQPVLGADIRRNFSSPKTNISTLFHSPAKTTGSNSTPSTRPQFTAEKSETSSATPEDTRQVRATRYSQPKGITDSLSSSAAIPSTER